MTDHPGFGVSVVLRYFVLPALVLGLLTLWCGRMGLTWRPRVARPQRMLWALIATFWVVYGVMGSLAYLAFRTGVQDLGVYDQRVWILSAALGVPSPRLIIDIIGHFSPLLVIHALLYKIYPSALVLIWTQVLAVGLGAYPVYRLAKRHLGPGPALIFAAGYLLYPSVVFSVRFDFHPDHLLIPLLLLAFDLLDRGNGWVLAGVSVCMLLVKESLVPSVVAFGAYAVVVRRRYVLGILMALGGAAALGVLVTRRYGYVFTEGTAGGESYGYLGGDLLTVLRTVVLSPETWLRELGQVPKLKFLFLMLAPLLFLPVFAPMALVVAVPGLAMSLLSQHPHRYQIWAQYMAPIIPSLIVAAVFGFRRLASSDAVRRALPQASRQTTLLIWVLGAGLYFNVVFSPSPISTVFWLGVPEQHRWSYHASAYLVTERDREIRQALYRYVSSDPRVSVSTQNSLNSSHLAHRLSLRQFPDEAHVVVVDTRRPPYLHDRLDPVGFSKALAEARQRRPIFYEADGFVIFGPLRPA